MARRAAALWWAAAWLISAFPWAQLEIDAGIVFPALATALFVAYTMSKSVGLSLRHLPDAPEGRSPRLTRPQRTLLALVVILSPVCALLLSAVPDWWFNDLSAVEQDLLGAAGFGVLGGLAIGALGTTLRALHCRWAEWRNGDEIVRVSLRYKSWLASRPGGSSGLEALARSEIGLDASATSYEVQPVRSAMSSNRESR